MKVGEWRLSSLAEKWVVLFLKFFIMNKSTHLKRLLNGNASYGKTTYVHCKAGRGRSTTIVLCYLVEYKHMTHAAALEYVRSRRPRVLLAPSQWKAVQEYKQHQLVLLHSLHRGMLF